jgi:hypothetical protein
MQEQFVLKAKTAIKRVAAMSTGALMLGATALGAVAATDLGDYPAPFVTGGVWSGLVVVGSAANAADIVGATDIIGRLTQEAVSPVSGTGTTTVIGGVTGKALFGEGIANSSISDAIDYELEDDDISSLADSTITYNSTTYDYREMIKLNQDSPVVETSLTGTDDDYETTAYMEVARSAISYYYVFDKSIDISDASTSVPLTIDFLGKNLKITSVDTNGNGFTAYVGDEYFMNVGDSVVANGKTITLNNVASCTASPCNVIVDVDGELETVSGTETVNGIEITVDETFYSDTTAERSASLIVGEQASESYTNDDEYPDYCATKWSTAGCKKTDPDWKWVIGRLDQSAVGDTTQGSGGPTIGIDNDYVVNGDDDNPITVGGCYDFPNDFAEICFDSLSTTDYMDLTLEYEADVDISNAAVSTATSEKVLHIYASEADTLELQSQNITGLSAAQKTDEIYIWWNSTNHLTIMYEDTNNDIVEAGYIKMDEIAAVNPIARVIYGATKSTNIQIELNNNLSGATNMNLTLNVIDDDSDITNGWDDLESHWLLTADTDIAGLGTAVGSNEAGELDWGNQGGAWLDLSTKDENHMTQYGIIVRDPKSNGASDVVKLQVPNDVVRANVIVKGTSSSVATTGGSVQINSIAGVDLVKLDTEVTDKMAKPMIIVGGPCINPMAAEALGLTYPACGASSTIPENKALIKLVENAFGGTNVALVVAGWEATNTRDAANVLKKYDEYATQLVGKMAVEVSGTTVTAVTAEPVVDDTPVA